MSLINKIENLQKKPEHYRYKILITSLIIIMSVIIFVWVSVISLSFEPKMEKKNLVGSPVNTVLNTLRHGSETTIKSIKEGFSTFQDQLKSIFENEQYKYEQERQ